MCLALRLLFDLDTLDPRFAFVLLAPKNRCSADFAGAAKKMRAIPSSLHVSAEAL